VLPPSPKKVLALGKFQGRIPIAMPKPKAQKMLWKTTINIHELAANMTKTKPFMPSIILYALIMAAIHKDAVSQPHRGKLPLLYRGIKATIEAVIWTKSLTFGDRLLISSRYPTKNVALAHHAKNEGSNSK
jgi:hypothetical protein